MVSNNTKIIIICNDQREMLIIHDRLHKLSDELNICMRTDSRANFAIRSYYKRLHVWFGNTIEILVLTKDYVYIDCLYCDYFAISTFDLDYVEKWQRQLSPHGKELTTFDAIKEKITELISEGEKEGIAVMSDYEKENIAVMRDIVKQYMGNDIQGVQAATIRYQVCNGHYIRPLKTLVPAIKNVIFNDPATIVFWADGSKTVVKAQDGDIFDPEKGLAMAISKKALGNKGNYCNELKKWLPKEEILIDDCKNCAPLCHSKVLTAYQRLVNTLHDKKATKADFGAAMEEAIGYLGEALDD